MDRLSILVVDDEGPFRRRILDLLRRQASVGPVSQAANGVQAVEAIREHSPDVVFLDVQMPELDGFGVIAQIGADDCNPRVVDAGPAATDAGLLRDV
jgi:two-component system LytT family response regulator